MNVDGVTVTPEGALAVIATGPEKPFDATTPTATFPLPLAGIAVDGGVTVSAKSGLPK